MKKVFVFFFSLSICILSAQKFETRNLFFNMGVLLEEQNSMSKELWQSKFPQFKELSEGISPSNFSFADEGRFLEAGIGFGIEKRSNWIFSASLFYFQSGPFYNSYSQREQSKIGEFEFQGDFYDIILNKQQDLYIKSELKRLGVQLKTQYFFYPKQNISPYVGLGLGFSGSIASKLYATYIDFQNISWFYFHHLDNNYNYTSSENNLGFVPSGTFTLPVGLNWGFGERKVLSINAEFAPMVNFYQVRDSGFSRTLGFLANIGLVINAFHNTKPLIRGTR